MIAPPAVYQPPAGLGRVRHPRRTPSGSEKRSVSGKLLFSPDSAGARDRGTLLHALLQQVEWIDSAETALSAWFAAALPSPERWQAAVLAEAKKILTDPGVRQLFTRPADAAGLWRERTFECILDGEWVTGAFDRVVLLPGRAHVIDFKTDAVAAADVPDKAGSYQPQMNLYRRVLAQLLGIAESDIAATLLFTATGVLHPA
jgi:ATP-dependent exoDNAse (exonuclease V) beta subunit